jgi:hypothetical protein
MVIAFLMLHSKSATQLLRESFRRFPIILKNEAKRFFELVGIIIFRGSFTGFGRKDNKH